MLNEIYHAIDPVAFTIGTLQVRWYGIAYILGFAAAAFVVYRIAKHWKVRLDIDSVLTVLLFVIVGVLVGARLGYCLFYGNGYYFEHPLEIFNVGAGGMSFHGGLVGAFLFAIPSMYFVKGNYFSFADMAVVGAPLGLLFGRIANFINGELWGAVTDLPWGVIFDGSAGPLPRHPSQLYEAILEGLVIFVVLIILARKSNPPRPQGTFLGLFLIMYGVFRFAVEFVRQPDAQLGYLFGTDWITMGQVLSVPLIVAGAFVLWYAIKYKRPQQCLYTAEEWQQKHPSKKKNS